VVQFLDLLQGDPSKKPAAVPAKRGLPGRSLLLILGMIAVTAGVVLPNVMSVMTGKNSLSEPAPFVEPAPLVEPAAKAQTEYAPPAQFEAENPGKVLLHLVLGTVLVLGLSGGVLWTAKRWLASGPAGKKSGQLLQLLETLPLNYRCSVHLLQVGGHQVLAAVDGSGIKTLLTLPEPFEHALRGEQTHDLALLDPAEEVIVPISKHLGR